MAPVRCAHPERLWRELQMQVTNLIMDLTREQGGGRETQVQPPSGVWEQFFGVRINAARPTFRLVRADKNSIEPEQRKVVKHHHNLTIEISGAVLPRPAILRMRKTGQNSFEYWIYRPPSKAYSHCDWILHNLAVPYPDRRWIVF
jgi:protease II